MRIEPDWGLAAQPAPGFPVAQWFIDNGADVNNGNNQGETPLDVAKEKQHLKLIEILEKAGAKSGAD